MPASDHQSDVWILKTDMNGDTLWTKTYGGDGNDYCTCIRQISDGGYIIVGFLNPEDTMDILLAKVDPAGEPVWTGIIGESYFLEFARCIRQMEDGYVIAGH